MPSAARASNRDTVESLVAGLRRADPHAMRQLFETYSKWIAYTLRRLLGNDDELDDLVHDVFVDPLEAIDKLRDPAALPAWLKGIAVIRAKRRLQRQYRRRWLRFTANGELPDVSSAPGDLEARVAFASIAHILDSMRPEDRIAVLLYRVDGMTTDAGAKAMNVSVSTFKRRLARGERHLLKLAQRSALVRLWLSDRNR